MIGILTFHDTTNFGSLLQTYGLYKAIRNQGFDCEVIDYKSAAIVKREIPTKFKFSFSPRELAHEVFAFRKTREKYRNFCSFLNREMKISPTYDIHNISTSGNRYNKIIVGSDIVWGIDITSGDLTYFLNFISDPKKKYAFASSIGDRWNDNQESVIVPLLNDFNRIAVREEQAKEWIFEATGRNADVVCDPTMLLTSTEWGKFTSTKFENEKYVLVYFDTKNKDCLNRAKEIAKKKNLKIFLINYGRPILGVRSIAPTTLEDFLSLIKNASEVVTASYHGLLFSLYFNTEVIYYNRAHRSRMDSIAELLGIDNRNGFNQTTPIKMDYPKVNQKLNSLRSNSLQILKEILYD